MDLLDFVPKRIEELCKMKRITAYALAKKAGVKQSILSNIQNKGTMPTLETLNKICDGLGVTISQFFQDESSNSELSDYEIYVLESLKSISEEERKLVEAYLRALVDTNKLRQNKKTEER